MYPGIRVSPGEWHGAPSHRGYPRFGRGLIEGRRRSPGRGCSGGEVRAVLQTLVPQPEQVEAHLVASDDLIVVKRAPSTLRVRLRPRRLTLLPHAGLVTHDELVEIGAGHALGLEREVLVGAEVVDPRPSSSTAPSLSIIRVLADQPQSAGGYKFLYPPIDSSSVGCAIS